MRSLREPLLKGNPPLSQKRASATSFTLIKHSCLRPCISDLYRPFIAYKLIRLSSQPAGPVDDGSALGGSGRKSAHPTFAEGHFNRRLLGSSARVCGLPSVRGGSGCGGRERREERESRRDGCVSVGLRFKRWRVSEETAKRGETACRNMRGMGG
jgi:hypothetical protein